MRSGAEAAAPLGRRRAPQPQQRGHDGRVAARALRAGPARGGAPRAGVAEPAQAGCVLPATPQPRRSGTARYADAWPPHTRLRAGARIDSFDRKTLNSARAKNGARCACASRALRNRRLTRTLRCLSEQRRRCRSCAPAPPRCSAPRRRRRAPSAPPTPPSRSCARSACRQVKKMQRRRWSRTTFEQQHTSLELSTLAAGLARAGRRAGAATAHPLCQGAMRADASIVWGARRRRRRLRKAKPTSRAEARSICGASASSLALMFGSASASAHKAQQPAVAAGRPCTGLPSFGLRPTGNCTRQPVRLACADLDDPRRERALSFRATSAIKRSLQTSSVAFCWPDEAVSRGALCACLRPSCGLLLLLGLRRGRTRRPRLRHQRGGTLRRATLACPRRAALLHAPSRGWPFLRAAPTTSP